jgi:4-amino-4-deoxy-L-arabinose transferase-like glycosyltransferase
MRSPAVLIGILVVAAAVRLPGFFSFDGGRISEKVLWYDEAYSALFASLPLPETVRLSGYDTTPTLFAVFLGIWTRAFGDGVAVMALLPYLLAIASIVVVREAGKALGGERVGVAAAALVAIDPLHIRYSTEVRAYSLTFLAAALSALFLIRFLKRGKGVDGALWAAAIVVGLYSHYTFLFVAFIEAAVAFAGVFRTRRLLRLTIGLGAAAVVACIPQLVLFKRWGSLVAGAGATAHFQRGFSHGDLGTPITYLASLAFGERMFYPLTASAASATLAAGLAVGAGMAAIVFRRRSPAAMALAASVAGGIVLMMAFRFIHAPRYFLPFVLPLALLAGLAFRSHSDKRAPWMAAALVAAAIPAAIAARPAPAASFVYYAPAFADAIERQEREGDLVLVDHFTDVLFRRYYDGRSDVALFFPARGRNVADLAERFGSCDFNLISAADGPTLEALTAGRDRVWTVDYLPQRTSVQDPAGIRRSWFEERFRLAGATPYPADAPPGAQQVVLLRYERP